MTWELATFLSVVLICFTTIICWPVTDYIFSQIQSDGVSPDEFETMKVAVGKIQSEYEVIQKLAEETKKLLSQENLAKSLGARR